MSITEFIKRQPVLTYYTLTFAISWGGILLLLVLFGGLPDTKEQFEAMVPTAIPALLGGPSVAGLLMTGLVYGKQGFRDLLSRLFTWRVGMRWYAAAFLTGPLVLLAQFLVLSFFSPVFIPDVFSSSGQPSRLALAVAGGLGAGILEELGWTGFVIPELRRRHRILATGLIAGVLWGAWHILANIVLISKAYAGGLSPAFFIPAGGLVDLIGILPAFRVLMVWVYDRTRSLLVAMLMHFGLTFGTILFEPSGIAGTSLLIYSVASAATMWAVVAAVVVAHGGELDYH